MCFSAEASFAASGALAASSIAIARLPKEKGSQALSLVPAIFAAHQFIEGLVWLNQDGMLPAATQSPTVYAYAFIAYVLWPVFVPFAAYRMETERRRRIVILVCQGAGLGTGASLLASFLLHPVTVSATCCSLSYHVQAPEGLMVPYLAAVSIPFLVCSRKGLVLFGAGVALSSAAAAVTTAAATFPSVWCFFAAVLSGGLYLYFRTAAQPSSPPLRTGAASGAMAR